MNLTDGVTPQGSIISGSLTSGLIITSTSPLDAGTYDCVATIGCASQTSNSAALTVNAPPSISAQPSPQSACLGQPFSFGITAAGSPAPTYQWRKDGTAIAGATSSTYSSTATASSPGSYDCIVTNSCAGTTSAAATLALNSAPSITSDPVSQSICVGMPFSFSVVASGSPTLTYQWRKGGAAITGASSSTYSGSAFSAAAGSYDCIVSNACASATSAAATLTTCPADFNCSGIVTVQDIFDFLAAWFAGSPRADFNASGALGVQDIFDFLGAWFQGC